MRSSTIVALPIAELLLATLYGHCAGAEVRVQGSAGDVRVEAHGASVAEILAALGEHYPVHYRGAPVGSDLTATFEGPLRRVVVRVLAGNDFVIKRGGDGLEVILLGPGSSGATSHDSPGAVLHPRDPFTPK
jgi:hypothetical protein